LGLGHLLQISEGERRRVVLRRGAALHLGPPAEERGEQPLSDVDAQVALALKAELRRVHLQREARAT
jgi:hypothetical protein